MKALSKIFALIWSLSAFAQNCPNGIYPHYSWNDLSQSQIDRYLTAVKALQKKPVYLSMVKDHSDNYDRIHNGGIFFPFHRLFIKQFEDELRKIDRDVIIPYWQWTTYAQNPAQDKIWQTYSRLGDSRPANDRILGVQTFNYPSQGHRLVRGLTTSEPRRGVYGSLNQVSNIIQAFSDYQQFRNTIEFGVHVNVHAGIAGQNGDMGFTFSPIDSIFYLHHGFVDKIWWWRQNFNNSMYFDHIDGDITPDTTIFSYPQKVSQVLDTKNLCFVYMPEGSTPKYGPLTQAELNSYDPVAIANAEIGFRPPAPVPTPSPPAPNSSRTTASTQSNTPVTTPASSNGSSRPTPAPDSGSQQGGSQSGNQDTVPVAPPPDWFINRMPGMRDQIDKANNITNQASHNNFSQAVTHPRKIVEDPESSTPSSSSGNSSTNASAAIGDLGNAGSVNVSGDQDPNGFGHQNQAPVLLSFASVLIFALL